MAVNNNASTVAFTVELPAAGGTFNEAVSKSHTIAAAAGGRAGVGAFGVNVPGNVLQTGGVIHIDSADANFGDVDFIALLALPTPR